MQSDDKIFLSSSSDSDRIIYTPSDFARSALFYLQETGTLQALLPHTSSREGLASYLFFVVHSGSGTLTYGDAEYQLFPGDCVFIDCQKPYSHSTSSELWQISWCHFFGPNMDAIYDKYLKRGGKPAFTARNSERYRQVLRELYDTASSTSYVRDMIIQEKICSLLAFLMEDSWSSEGADAQSGKAVSIRRLKDYLDGHYTEKIRLDDLAARFYINKYYMLRLFKEQYGFSIQDYVIRLRVTRGKHLLRFGKNDDGSPMTVEQICAECGIADPNYFTRIFKKVEGVSPSEYRKVW
jgi:AraC-like DNA-binding protein